MREPIEAEYFNWLCAKVLDLHGTIYYDLLRILYNTEFIWIVTGDKNREEDGLELRIDFLRESSWEKDQLWFNQPASVLEVLIAFAKRASFQTDSSVQEWFWIFMNNLKLDDYRQVSDADVPQINDILNTFIWRTYDPNGYGGICPVQTTTNDQRQVEMWYQWCEMVDEQGLF